MRLSSSILRSTASVQGPGTGESWKYKAFLLSQHDSTCCPKNRSSCLWSSKMTGNSLWGSQMHLSALPDCYRDRQMGGAASTFLPCKQPSSVLNYCSTEEYRWQVGEQISNSAVQLLGGTTLIIYALKRHLFSYTEVRMSQSQKWQNWIQNTLHQRDLSLVPSYIPHLKMF